jgi:hypothetical protein
MEIACFEFSISFFGGVLKQLDFSFDDADAVQEGTLFAIVGRKGVAGRESILKEKVRCAWASIPLKTLVVCYSPESDGALFPLVAVSREQIVI